MRYVVELSLFGIRKIHWRWREMSSNSQSMPRTYKKIKVQVLLLAWVNWVREAGAANVWANICTVFIAAGVAMTKPTLSHLPAIPVPASAFSLKGSALQAGVGTLKSWIQVLKARLISTLTIWGLGPKETSKRWLGNYLKSIHHLEMPTQNVLPPKKITSKISQLLQTFIQMTRNLSPQRCQTQLTELFLNQFPVISMPPGTGSPRRCQNIWHIS